MKTYLGMDFGGTKLLIGEVDAQGNVLHTKRYATGFTKQADAVQALLEAVRDYRDTVGFEGELAAGVGIVGIVDNRRGEWISLGHDPEGPPVPLARLVSRELGVPCGIDNDVRSATTAELILGQGRRSQNFIYLNVGTGLGAGFVAEGQVLRGANMNAGEIGHMVVDLSDKTPCVCGRVGCVENSVSGVGFTQQARARGLDDLMTQAGGRADVLRLFDRAEAGDADCREIIEYGARAIACVILNLVRVTDPDTIVYGGSIMSDERFLRLVKEALHPQTMRGVTNGLVPSSFRPQYAGLLGAASLGMVKARVENYQFAMA
ncbi:MAG: ROK family protein [Subdoligranulum sp.]|nr:ROK family protein [Subdoligranulum sp.]